MSLQQEPGPSAEKQVLLFDRIAERQAKVVQSLAHLNSTAYELRARLLGISEPEEATDAKPEAASGIAATLENHLGEAERLLDRLREQLGSLQRL